jgi:hypothetical protein
VRFRRIDYGAATWVRSFVAKNAPQDDAGAPWCSAAKLEAPLAAFPFLHYIEPHKNFS